MKLDHFLSFVNFEPVERVPRRAGFVEEMHQKMKDYLGEDPFAHFKMDFGRGTWLRAPEDYKPADYTPYFPEYAGNPNFSIDEFGCGHLKGGFHHFTEYIGPLRNATTFDEILAFPIYDNSTFLDDKMIAEAKAARAEGDYTSAWVGDMYEKAWQVRGYQPFLTDLLTEREWAEYLLDCFMNCNMRTAIAAARAGYDCITTGDDVANQNNMMFAPELWREVMKPRWAKVFGAARAIKPDIAIWYHSDGNITDVIDDLVEIGVTILNPVQPECMDPLALRKRYGKRLAFDGCVGTQTTFPFGKPADMHRVVRELATSLDAHNGGLLLAPTHVLEPEVPCENVVAFFEACDRL